MWLALQLNALQCGAAQLEPNSIPGGHSVGFALVALVPVLDSALAVVRGGPTADKYPTLRTYIPVCVYMCICVYVNTCIRV